MWNPYRITNVSNSTGPYLFTNFFLYPVKRSHDSFPYRERQVLRVPYQTRSPLSPTIYKNYKWKTIMKVRILGWKCTCGLYRDSWDPVCTKETFVVFLWWRDFGWNRTMSVEPVENEIERSIFGITHIFTRDGIKNRGKSCKRRKGRVSGFSSKHRQTPSKWFSQVPYVNIFIKTN